MRIYWGDLILSSFLFVVNFYLTIKIGSTITFILACIFLYRVGAFTHEIAHQNKNKKIKLFKIFWNLTIGCLILQPSIRFTIPHLKHHTVGIFATEKDPQYPLIFSDTKLAFIIFVLLPFILPLYNLSLCLIPFKNNQLNDLINKTIYSEEEHKEILLYEMYYVVVFLLTFILISFYLVNVGAWFLSVLRIPLEHPLNYYKKTSNQKDQEVLSFTHTAWIYIILQPLGLRYHTTHHMFPKIPYHNLRLKIN
jgi:fatty acid desaturase